MTAHDDAAISRIASALPPVAAATIGWYPACSRTSRTALTLMPLVYLPVRPRYRLPKEVRTELKPGS